MIGKKSLQPLFSQPVLKRHQDSPVRWTARTKLGVVLCGLGAYHEPSARSLLRQAEG
jgi:hypothetical protein